MVEREFATGYEQVQAMLNGGGFFDKNRSAFWAEAARDLEVPIGAKGKGL